MNTTPGCRCGALPWDCVCGTDLVEVGKSSSGYPVNAAGEILPHLCTPEQRREINEATVQRVDFSRRQFG